MEDLERVDMVDIQKGFWQGKRVLVTGHTGFKGGWLTVVLADLGAEVFGCGLEPSTDPSLFQVAALDECCHHCVQDVRDFDGLSRLMSRVNPEIVFHLAAQSIVLESYTDPVGTYATNVMGTLHVLEVARRLPGLRAVVIVTSDKCYSEQNLGRAFRENDPLGGLDPYSSSKACAEIITGAYRQSYLSHKDDIERGVGIASVRAGNVFGGGDWNPYRLIPDAVRAFSAGRILELRHPNATRPWQFVFEPLRGYMLLAERLWNEPAVWSEAWNFGPSEYDIQTVESVARAFADCWGSEVSCKEDFQQEAPHEASVLKLDSSKALDKLGWQTRVSLRDGLRFAADWYKDYYAGMSSSHLRERIVDTIRHAMADGDERQ